LLHFAWLEFVLQLNTVVENILFFERLKTLRIPWRCLRFKLVVCVPSFLSDMGLVNHQYKEMSK